MCARRFGLRLDFHEHIREGIAFEDSTERPAPVAISVRPSPSLTLQVTIWTPSRTIRSQRLDGHLVDPAELIGRATQCVER